MLFGHAKNTTVEINPTSMYVGKPRSADSSYIYDKQMQMRDKKRIHTGTWTKVEMRYNLPQMKRVSGLTAEDSATANQYYVVTDTSLFSDCIKGIVDGLNAGHFEWAAFKEGRKTK